MLDKGLPHKGGRPKKRCHDVTVLKLKELDISYKQSERWQVIAKLPPKIFESYIQENKEGANEITTAGALKFFA